MAGRMRRSGAQADGKRGDNRAAMKPAGYYRALPRRFRNRPVLIVGCGDVGTRIGAALAARGLRVLGTVRTPDKAPALRQVGIVPLIADLDARRDLRVGAWARRLIDLAPPPGQGTDDPRSRHLIAALATRSARGPGRPLPAGHGEPASRRVYVSTTGVYGDCAGARFDETRPAAPASDRAVRRVAAEQLWRRASRRGEGAVSILRVPGIYAHDRLPLDRLRAGLPALLPEHDVYTNHVHADDLARICVAALWRGRAARIVHAVDDTDLKMGDYFDRVADAAGLPRPPRLDPAALARRVSPAMLSFMRESRRLANERLKRELRVRLRYPTVDHTLAEAFGSVVN